jgi:hypothetical protein
MVARCRTQLASVGNICLRDFTASDCPTAAGRPNDIERARLAYRVRAHCLGCGPVHAVAPRLAVRPLNSRATPQLSFGARRHGRSVVGRKTLAGQSSHQSHRARLSSRLCRAPLTAHPSRLKPIHALRHRFTSTYNSRQCSFARLFRLDRLLGGKNVDVIRSKMPNATRPRAIVHVNYHVYHVTAASAKMSTQ